MFPAYSFSRESVEDVPKDSPCLQSAEWPPQRTEAQLLASDGDEDEQRGSPPARKLQRDSSPGCADFYLDRQLDRGNLRVSTLYYPGRPE